MNCTPAMPTLEEAVAETVMVPETVAPDAGELIEKVGGVETVLLTLMVTVALVLRCPMPSRAPAVRL